MRLTSTYSANANRKSHIRSFTVAFSYWVSPRNDVTKECGICCEGTLISLDSFHRTAIEDDVVVCLVAFGIY